MAKPIPGPTFRLDNALPCGCRICRDDGTQKLRLWYCPTHAAAFEMLEALKLNLSALDTIINNAPPATVDVTSAMDAAMRARTTIRRASSGL